jgi:hypothetical protein
MNWKNTAAVFLLLANVSALAANVQEANPQADVAAEDIPQTVTVHGVRDPAIAPYADAYRMLGTVREASGGKVDLLIRLLSATSLQPIPDLELSLRGETISEKLRLSPDGFLEVPLDKRYLDDRAEILTNKKKGSVRVEFYFVPKLPQEGITYGDMAASIGAAKRAVKEIVPWYLRMLGSSIDKVRLCYPDEGRQIGLSRGESATRPASSAQKSMLTKETVYCAAFDAREVASAQDTIVTAPLGWVALFD